MKKPTVFVDCPELINPRDQLLFTSAAGQLITDHKLTPERVLL